MGPTIQVCLFCLWWLQLSVLPVTWLVSPSIKVCSFHLWRPQLLALPTTWLVSPLHPGLSILPLMAMASYYLASEPIHKCLFLPPLVAWASCIVYYLASEPPSSGSEHSFDGHGFLNCQPSTIQGLCFLPLVATASCIACYRATMPLYPGLFLLSTFYGHSFLCCLLFGW